LGTFVEITSVGSAHAVDAAFGAIAQVHARMSFHDAASDLGRLRAAAPDEVVAVARETVEVLRTALALHQASNGLFDVAVGRALIEAQYLPHHGIKQLGRFRGTTADIRIVDETHVALSQPVLIDLGGIAKGYAVDRAVDSLMRSGASAGLVNAGGDLRAFGPQDWPVGLRDADGVVRTQIGLREGALASSANLQDRRPVRGRTCSPHIGRDGHPILVDRRITVHAQSCIIADAMTKVAMVDPAVAGAILLEYGGRVLPDATSDGAI
jgi:thiamine biosynthesis lipoprotein